MKYCITYKGSSTTGKRDTCPSSFRFIYYIQFSVVDDQTNLFGIVVVALALKVFVS